MQALLDFVKTTGYYAMTWQQGLMILVSCVLLYLAIVKKFEPLLLVPIAFGMLLANLPLAGLMDGPTLVKELLADGSVLERTQPGGLLYYLYQGVKLGIYPPLIFLGVGALTDFGPLIANPKTILLGAAAQLGIFITFLGALLMGFNPQEAASIGIIGGADGPTAIYLTTKLAPHLLGPIAIAAYSYMALVPIIQPPIMRALTTKKERMVVMEQLRPVSKFERVIFPIVTTIAVGMLVPSAAALVGSLMMGNLFREIRRRRKAVQDSPERPEQHNCNIPRCNSRGYGIRREIPNGRDAKDYRNGPCSIRRRHRRRRAARKAHVLDDGRKGQSSNRLRRSLGSADGSARLTSCRPEGQSKELPSDACDGAERGRSHRLSNCRRHIAFAIRTEIG